MSICKSVRRLAFKLEGMQVGILRRGRYMKGKKIGKANVAEEVSHSRIGSSSLLLLPLA